MISAVRPRDTLRSAHPKTTELGVWRSLPSQPEINTAATGGCAQRASLLAAGRISCRSLQERYGFDLHRPAPENRHGRKE